MLQRLANPTFSMWIKTKHISEPINRTRVTQRRRRNRLYIQDSDGAEDWREEIPLLEELAFRLEAGRIDALPENQGLPSQADVKFSSSS